MLLVSLGAMATASGVVGIYRCWASPIRARTWLRRASWMALLLSLPLWVGGVGAEFGVAYMLMALMLTAWVAVVFNRQVRHRPERAKPSQALRAPSLASVIKHVCLLVAVVPLAGAAAILSSAALTLVLPWKPVNEMVFGVLSMPFLWGVAAYWVCADGKPLRPGLALLGCAGVSALALFT